MKSVSGGCLVPKSSSSVVSAARGWQRSLINCYTCSPKFALMPLCLVVSVAALSYYFLCTGWPISLVLVPFASHSPSVISIVYTVSTL